jgi:hypothetical protein
LTQSLTVLFATGAPSVASALSDERSYSGEKQAVREDESWKARDAFVTSLCQGLVNNEGGHTPLLICCKLWLGLYASSDRYKGDILGLFSCLLEALLAEGTLEPGITEQVCAIATKALSSPEVSIKARNDAAALMDMIGGKPEAGQGLQKTWCPRVKSAETQGSVETPGARTTSAINLGRTSAAQEKAAATVA